MNFLNDNKKLIEKNLIFVSTSSKLAIPHVIVCQDCKVFENKLLITDNYMEITKNNILENDNISLCVGSLKNGFLYISGKVDYKTSGKYYNFVKDLKENKGFPCKGVLVITCKKINFGK
ncbi:MAG: pyridoxamine 5'-phosphate oxidase family protein [Candidatus ainarchaeum sp.]|jgi:predicted pyridoxine 5'-phosphate oxidase superfamily flavin-nucleotide-binding protein|nr:pyridoxamine 5'-phosphate oxidase family protein [Candidatus ainarchaeum sp.]